MDRGHLRFDGAGTRAHNEAGAIDTGGFPFNGNGGAINVTVNGEGFLQVT